MPVLRPIATFSEDPQTKSKSPVFLTLIGPVVAFLAVLLMVITAQRDVDIASTNLEPLPTATPVTGMVRLWEYQGRIFDQDSMVVADDILYSIASDYSQLNCAHPQVNFCSYLTAIDLATGNMKMSISDLLYPPTISDGVIYSGILGQYSAIDMATQKTKWQFSVTLTTANESEDSPKYAPTVANGVVYIAHGNTVFAVSADTGEELWHATYEDKITSPPIVANGMVYVTSNRPYMKPNTDVMQNVGTLFANDMRYGQNLWEYMPSDDNAEISAPVASSDGTIYLMSSYTGSSNLSYVFAISGQTGQAKWIESLDSMSSNELSALVLDGDTLYVASINDGIYALNTKTGSKLWKSSAAGIGYQPPAVTGNIVYYLSEEGDAYAIHTETKSEQKYSDLGFPFKILSFSNYSFPYEKIVQSNGKAYFLSQKGDALDAFVVPK